MFLGAQGPNFSGFSKYFVITLNLFLAFVCPIISEICTSVLNAFLSFLFSNSSVISWILVVSEIIELLGFAYITSKP